MQQLVLVDPDWHVCPSLRTDIAVLVYLQNFNVILTQHNPARDKNVHFIVQPKMAAKDRQLIAQRKVPTRLRALSRACTATGPTVKHSSSYFGRLMTDVRCLLCKFSYSYGFVYLLHPDLWRLRSVRVP